jgi:hypothetical protein
MYDTMIVIVALCDHPTNRSNATAHEHFSIFEISPASSSAPCNMAQIVKQKRKVRILE